MKRLLPLVLFGAVVACSRPYLPVWRPSFTQPPGLASNIWESCIQRVRNYVWNHPDAGDLSNEETDCAVHLIMEWCANEAMAHQLTIGGKHVTEVMPGNLDEYLREMEKRRNDFCGGGGSGGPLVQQILHDAQLEAEAPGGGQLVCPPPNTIQ